MAPQIFGTRTTLNVITIEDSADVNGGQLTA